MNVRIATSTAVVLIGLGALMPSPTAQTTSPPTAAAKKNPLLKLAEPWPDADALKKRKVEADARPLFASAAPLEFSLTSNFNALNKDRKPESTTRYPAVLTVNGADGAPHEIPVKLSARGHFRRMARNCGVVPLRVEFSKEGTAGTPFEGQSTLKLGTGCEDSKEFEQITLREYITYPMFNLVTPLSFRARLARASYIDEKSKKKSNPRYALFIENDSDVARRAEGRIVDLPRVVFTDLESKTLTQMMLFEYMIGNTDMSIYANHNVKLVQKPDRTLSAVPYDFDLSGLVHAPYAIPDRRLGLRTVVDRMYRGPCRTADEFDAAAAPFRAKKTEMIGLVEGLKDLDNSSRSEVKDYLESFFRTIDKPDSIKKNFVNGCKAQTTM
jgi:hypothetical protein